MWGGVDEVEEEGEEEHAEDGMNGKLINPVVDDGTRCDKGCRRRRTMAVAAVAAVAAWLGHVVSTNLVQAHCGMDVGSNMPMDIELRCTPHYLIDVVPPPHCCHRCRHQGCHHIVEKYSKYDYFAYIRRNFIGQKIVHSRN